MASRRFVALVGATCAGAFVLASAREASAQQSERDQVARRGLIEQAQQAHEQGDHARALELATRAGALSMTPSLRMFIAEEHAHLGHVVSSLGAAQTCIAEAERDLAARNRADVLARCRQIEAELRERVGTVIVRVPSPAPAGLRVEVGGEELNPALYGAPVPAAAGAVVVEASARGLAPFREELTVAARVTSEVTVTLAPPQAPRAVGDVPSARTRASGGATAPGGRRGPGAGSFVVLGVGVASFGASLGFYLARNAAIAGCEAQGRELVCFDMPSYTRALGAPTWNTLTNVALGVGAAFVVAGGIWLAVDLARGGAARARTEAPRARIDLAPAMGGASLTVRGVF